MRMQIGAAWRRLAWFVNGVLGANKYQQYLAHHRFHGHGEPLGEREFWCRETDRPPTMRCC